MKLIAICRVCAVEHQIARKRVKPEIGLCPLCRAIHAMYPVKNEAAERKAIGLYMVTEAEFLVDPKTGEVDATGLAEIAIAHFDRHDTWANDHSHYVWDEAVDVAEAHENTL